MGGWVDLEMSKYIQLLLLIGLALGQTYDPVTGEEVSNQSITEEKSILNKHNLSVGMFDDRTGLSLIGYTYNMKQTTMDEYFIGAGTMLLAYTGTVGWKHYYSRMERNYGGKYRLSVSSVVCGQIVAHLGFIGFMSTVSSTLEYHIDKWAQIKVGGLGLMNFPRDMDIEDFGTRELKQGISLITIIPFAGLNFTF